MLDGMRLHGAEPRYIRFDMKHEEYLYACLISSVWLQTKMVHTDAVPYEALYRLPLPSSVKVYVQRYVIICLLYNNQYDDPRKHNSAATVELGRPTKNWARKRGQRFEFPPFLVAALGAGLQSLVLHGRSFFYPRQAEALLALGVVRFRLCLTNTLEDSKGFCAVPHLPGQEAVSAAFFVSSHTLLVSRTCRRGDGTRRPRE